MGISKALDRLLALEEDLSKKREWMKEMVDQGGSEVANFYEGSVVFVTGGSGFIGKQLIEKLIRSCRVAKLYMMLRPKKGKSMDERLQNILQEPVFDSLRKEQPKFTELIVPVDGDIEQLKLGINENHRHVIVEEVNFIFHMASSTNFELPLKRAALINVRGTRELIDLAKECKHLRSMVYVSTAYTHATTSRIDGDVLEQFYDCPVPVQTMIQLAETQSQEILDNFMVPFKKEWPNTYTFTKAIAEEAVRQSGVPSCVVRPAVVIGSESEPGPGWTDPNAVFSVTGLFVGVGLGFLHLYYKDIQKSIDFVPVDQVNNAVIVAAKQTVILREAGYKEPKIYTMSSCRNTFDNRLSLEVFDEEYRTMVSPSAVWYCFFFVLKSKTIYTLLTWLIHYIPAMIIDVVFAVMGKKIRLMRIYKKAYTLALAMHHFVVNEWVLRDDNTVKLYENLSKVDKDIFNFNIETVDWRDCTSRWFYGIKKYILKDELKVSRAELRKQTVLKIITYILCLLYVYVIYKFFCFLYWIMLCIFSLF